ncbi:MAG: phosphatase PAP2 family protein [Candidatus Berkelbacteria bacterium]
MMINYIQALDLKILLWLNNFVKDWGFWNKLFAEYLIYVLPIILLWLWFYDQKSKKVAMRAAGSALVAFLVFAHSIGQFIHRARPFDSGGVRELLFHRPTYSFPSDHATVFFAIAASFWFSGNKKMGVAFFVLASINAIFRVATGIHWPTDVLAGAIIGIFTAYLVYLFDKPLNIVYEFVIKLAKKVNLA